MASASVSPVDCQCGNGATNTPDGSTRWPDRYDVFEVVIAIVWWVRPWNDPENTMTFGRPVACRANFSAASVASAPELAKKNVSIDGGVISASFSASGSSRSWR